jgi:ubiquinone/menaquinone biosynthesis C-methylase UbiE
MVEPARTYLPAAGHDWLLPFYDPFVKLFGGETARKTLLDQVALRPGHRVLEIGCGTGTLSTLIKRLHPGTEVVGLDPDPKALVRARRKAQRAGVFVRFDQGFGDQLPYPEASFDRVLSSFVFHHVPANEKGPMLREVRRVLKPGGRFHMLDFEGPGDGTPGLLARLFHANHRLQDNSESRVVDLMQQSGFVDAKKMGRRHLLLGNVAYYRAVA